MIEEVVNSILEAEDVAKQRVTDAETKASEIIAAAEAEADRIKKQASADNKEYLNTRLAEADAQAERIAKELLTELNAKTDVETAKLEKGIPAAVKIILESL